MHKNSKMTTKTETGPSICFICEEVIFNPICPDCLRQGVADWLNNKAQKILKKLDLEVSLIKKLNIEEKDKCSICNKDIDICPYCYTEILYELLKKERKELIPEFLKFFNFDFDKTGYSKEAELLNLHKDL